MTNKTENRVVLKPLIFFIFIVLAGIALMLSFALIEYEVYSSVQGATLESQSKTG